MTDNQNITIKFELPQVVNEALKPLASSIGITLSNMWDITFMGVNTWYQKKVLERDNNLQLFKEQLQNEVSIIKEENLQDPRMSIVGPAIESSKYYFEESHFREMFSKLLASACDSSKNVYIHPSFTEIIKQLDYKDATVLKLFKENSNQPICKYIFHMKFDETITMNNVFFINNDYEERERYCSSVTNLERLGLVTISFSTYIADKHSYDFFSNDPIFKDLDNTSEFFNKNTSFKC